MLSHTPPGARIMRNYDRSTLCDERRAALIAGARWLSQLKAAEPGKVIAFGRSVSGVA